MGIKFANNEKICSQEVYVDGRDLVVRGHRLQIGSLVYVAGNLYKIRSFTQDVVECQQWFTQNCPLTGIC